MDIAVYAACYNEEYMLPFFLQHYSFAKKITIYDNFSTDRSVEIMKDYKVNILQWDTEGMSSELKLAELKNNCWKVDKNYDLVMIVDIDELVYPINHFSKFYSIYRACGYQMLCDKLPVNGRPITEQVKTGARDPVYDKMCVFDPNRIKEIGYKIGSHQAHPEGDVVIHYENTVKLLHYNYLTLEYQIKRFSERAKRLTKEDIDKGHAINYLYSEDKIREIYNNHKSRLEFVVPLE